MADDKLKWLDNDAFKEAENELAWVQNDSSDYGRLRRLQLSNALADYCYGVHDILKSRGDHENADDARRRADGYWGQVIVESGVFKEEPDDGTSPLTPEAAARLLYRSRGGI